MAPRTINMDLVVCICNTSSREVEACGSLGLSHYLKEWCPRLTSAPYHIVLMVNCLPCKWGLPSGKIGFSRCVNVENSIGSPEPKYSKVIWTWKPHCNPSTGEVETGTVPRAWWTVSLAYVVRSKSERVLVSKGRWAVPEEWMTPEIVLCPPHPHAPLCYNAQVGEGFEMELYYISVK